MSYDPYSQAPAFGHVGASGNVLDSAEPPVDPYTGQRGDLEYRMTPRPITATSYKSLPTKESQGEHWGVPIEPAAVRIRGAVSDAWENAPSPIAPEYQEKMNNARDPFGNTWPGTLNRNVINPAINTVAAIPPAIGAGVGSTIAELTREAGVPALGRDINQGLSLLPVIGAGMAPVLPRTLTPGGVPRPGGVPGERPPVSTTPSGPLNKEALADALRRRAEREEVRSGGMPTPGPEGPASTTTLPYTVRGAVPGADTEVRVALPGQLPPPPGYVPSTPAVTIAKDAFGVAGAHYDLADHLGGKVGAKANDSFLDTKLTGIRTQDEAARRFNKADAVDLTISDLNDALRGQDLSLRGAQEIDRAMGDRISVALNQGRKEEASRLIQLQHALRDHVESVGEGEATGGPAGFAALKDARRAWAVAVRMQDIERMVEKAEGTLNPQQSMRTQVNNYVNNPKMTRGWDPKDLEALKNTAKSGNGAEILRTLSSRLAPIGGYALAGPLGAAAAVTETLLANQARDALSGLHRRRLEGVTQRLGTHLPGMPGSEIGPPAPPPGVIPTVGLGLPQPSQRGLLGSMVLGTDPGELRRQAEERARLEEQLRLRRAVQ